MSHSSGAVTRPLQIYSFGEVLFDLLPDGPHLGGAPLNLAVHLHQLGVETHLISAVGDDPLGTAALAGIVEQGLSTEYVATVPQPTGTVAVTLDAAKVPTYHFSENSAYDNIPVPVLADRTADLFCFGTLAQRNDISRATLKQLLSSINAPVFCDVNLRGNYYSKEILEESLNAANIVKLNEDELPCIAALFGFPSECGAFAERFQVETVILTLGPAGCLVLSDGHEVRSPAFPAKVVSTVGAGDSFSAAFLYHLLSGHGVEEAAAAGNRLAAEVASRPGAF